MESTQVMIYLKDGAYIIITMKTKSRDSLELIAH